MEDLSYAAPSIHAAESIHWGGYENQQRCDSRNGVADLE